jgi:hypothetical protein
MWFDMRIGILDIYDDDSDDWRSWPTIFAARRTLEDRTTFFSIYAALEETIKEQVDSIRR